MPAAGTNEKSSDLTAHFPLPPELSGGRACDGHRWFPAAGLPDIKALRFVLPPRDQQAEIVRYDCLEILEMGQTLLATPGHPAGRTTSRPTPTGGSADLMTQSASMLQFHHPHRIKRHPPVSKGAKYAR